MTTTSDDCLSVQCTARDVLARRYPTDRIAELADSPLRADPAGWSELTELGWFDADLPALAQVRVAEECGYYLTPQPWWPTMCLTVLGEARSGPDSVAIGFDETAGPMPKAVATWGDSWTLTGAVGLVPDLELAAGVIVAGDSPAGPMLFRVDLAAQGVDVHRGAPLDPLRTIGAITLSAARAEPVCHTPTAEATIAAIRSRGLLLLAAEAVGVARRAYDFAREYACARQQFGRPIGGYQAVAFRIADMYVELELARSLTLAAAGNETQAAVSCTLLAARRAA
ncbi:acyl-CoA dehydrogenase family protein, partial [Kribbella sp. NPDC050820]|uniref:acyl-CoA dehydrogenase family protein n=1 Tax=Kribbella sp. NPDC050820 TaxID=3155408 RepID=UPI0033E71AD6